MLGLLSASVRLKRSRRMSEEAAGPAGAISGLAADTSQEDPVALLQNMFAEGSFTSLAGKLSPGIPGKREREREEMAFCALQSECLTFFLPLSLHTSAFPELHRRNS